MSLKPRSTHVVLAASFAVVLSACGGSADNAGTTTGGGGEFEENFTTSLQMGTASPGGVYFPLGTQYANLFEDNIDVEGLQVSAIETSASVDNIVKIDAGDIQLGLAQSNTANAAVNGEGEFEGSTIDNIGFLATLYPEALHIITLESSGIESIEDLEGKQVAIGPPGSGSQSAARAVLSAHGIEEGDFTALQESFDDAKRKLQDGNADAVIEVMGVPYAGLQEIEAATNEVKLLPIAEEPLQTMLEETDYESYKISGDAYSFLEEPVQSVSAFAAMLASPSQVSPDLGYEMTKAIFEYADQLTLPQAAVIKTENALLGRGDVPFHPGAERYYKEIGLIE